MHTPATAICFIKKCNRLLSFRFISVNRTRAFNPTITAAMMKQITNMAVSAAWNTWGNISLIWRCLQPETHEEQITHMAISAAWTHKETDHSYGDVYSLNTRGNRSLIWRCLQPEHTRKQITHMAISTAWNTRGTDHWYGDIFSLNTRGNIIYMTISTARNTRGNISRIWRCLQPEHTRKHNYHWYGDVYSLNTRGNISLIWRCLQPEHSRKHITDMTMSTAWKHSETDH